jgi:hypothetical protein
MLPVPLIAGAPLRHQVLPPAVELGAIRRAAARAFGPFLGLAAYQPAQWRRRAALQDEFRFLSDAAAAATSAGAVGGDAGFDAGRA